MSYSRTWWYNVGALKRVPRTRDRRCRRSSASFVPRRRCRSICELLGVCGHRHAQPLSPQRGSLPLGPSAVAGVLSAELRRCPHLLPPRPAISAHCLPVVAPPRLPRKHGARILRPQRPRLVVADDAQSFARAVRGAMPKPAQHSLNVRYFPRAGQLPLALGPQPRAYRQKHPPQWRRHALLLRIAKPVPLAPPRHFRQCARVKAFFLAVAAAWRAIVSGGPVHDDCVRWAYFLHGLFAPHAGAR